MANPSPFLDLTLQIDTREQKKDRIDRISFFFESLGGAVTTGALKNCDYLITGELENMPLSLGIEYKTVDDLVKSWKELPERFTRAITTDADHIALFIEGRVTVIKHIEDGVYYVENSTSSDLGEVLPYYLYLSKILQWNEAGVHCWNINGLREFGPSMQALINHIVHVPHTMLSLPKNDWRRDRYALYQCIPGLGAKAAIKLCDHSVRYWQTHQALLLETLKPSKTAKFNDFIGVLDD